MDSRRLKAACLAVLLVSALAFPQIAHAFDIPYNHHVNLQANKAMSRVYLLYAAHNGADCFTSVSFVGWGEVGQRMPPAFPAGNSGSISIFVDRGGKPASYHKQFAIVGLFDADGDNDVDAGDISRGGVSISLGADSASYALNGGQGRTWSEVFTDPVYNESVIAAALMDADIDRLAAFTAQYYRMFSPLPRSNEGTGAGSLINFSAATPGGAVQAAAVPEPSSLAALGAGLFALAGLRRRK